MSNLCRGKPQPPFSVVTFVFHLALAPSRLSLSGVFFFLLIEKQVSASLPVIAQLLFSPDEEVLVRIRFPVAVFCNPFGNYSFENKKCGRRNKRLVWFGLVWVWAVLFTD